jgi:hypothetical protein
LLFSQLKMYLPDPLFALVLSHLTDGRPARRALAECRLGRAVEGWRATHPIYGHNTRWSVIRCALDIAAYMVNSESDGGGNVKIWFGNHKMPMKRIALIITRRGDESVAELLMGWWRHRPCIEMPIVSVTHSRLVYEYSPCIIWVDIISPDDYAKRRDDYEYFIFWIGTTASQDIMLDITHRIRAGLGQTL